MFHGHAALRITGSDHPENVHRACRSTRRCRPGRVVCRQRASSGSDRPYRRLDAGIGDHGPIRPVSQIRRVSQIDRQELRIDPTQPCAKLRKCSRQSLKIVRIRGGYIDIFDGTNVAVGDDREAADDHVVNGVPIECFEHSGSSATGRSSTIGAFSSLMGCELRHELDQLHTLLKTILWPHVPFVSDVVWIPPGLHWLSGKDQRLPHDLQQQSDGQPWGTQDHIRSG